jgi:anti-sigma regulatory factor (Ser/Thr protein kinase)
MQTEPLKAPQSTTFERSYLASVSQIRRVRADLGAAIDGFPIADDLVLLASELSTNAVVHSRSREPGGEFTVHAYVRPGDYAWLEVQDEGGPWTTSEPDDERGRGLAIVAAIAGDDNWGVDGGSGPGTRVVWARLNWPGEP